ncbi:MAG: hypothetical protein KC492_22495 [Myxococcales bacterium]|nr:hypothetical protein [Myxococcales bacterium]
MRTAIYALVLACVACGGEAHRAAPPSTPTHTEPRAAQPGNEQNSLLSQLVPDPTLSGSDADGSVFGDGDSLDDRCRGEVLDLAPLRERRRCQAEGKPDLPAPVGLELETPEEALIPYGKPFPFKTQLVNRSDERLRFVVTTGSYRPAVEVSRLRIEEGPLEHLCSSEDVASGPEFSDIELEPGGRLTVDGVLYPNDGLMANVTQCKPSPLTPGEAYQVELSVHVNDSRVEADWSFKIK